MTENMSLSLSPFIMHYHQWDEHLFHANTSMLEGVLEIIHVVVVIIWISEECVILSKNVSSAYIGRRQIGIFGPFYFKHLFWIITQVLAKLIAQIGVGILVAHNLKGGVDTY